MFFSLDLRSEFITAIVRWEGLAGCTWISLYNDLAATSDVAGDELINILLHDSKWRTIVITTRTKWKPIRQ
jgi:hypothetical protein